MPLPVVSNAYQARLVWTAAAAPRPATNNMYFQASSGGSAPLDVYTALNANVTNNMWNLVGGAAIVSTVVVTPLDGSSAGVVFTTGGPAKWQGSSGDMILQGCQVITERTALGGRSYRGRLYLPWIRENEQTNGVLDATVISSFVQPAWDAFLTAMNGTDFSPVVVSARHATAEPITSYVCRGNLTTQRRRAIRSI